MWEGISALITIPENSCRLRYISIFLVNECVLVYTFLMGCDKFDIILFINY